MNPIHAVAAVLALAAALPAAASAAQIQTDRPCYQDNAGTVAVSGNGFEPNQPYQVTLDGQPLPNGTGTTDAAGGIAGSFPTPELAGSSVHAYTLGVVQGANVPTTGFSVTPFLADFTPGSGNPKTLHVRFKVFGFGLVDRQPERLPALRAPERQAQAHDPARQGARRLRPDQAHPRRKLFPFNAERGNWKLQFDTRRRYRKGVQGSNFLFYTVGVTIRRIFG